MTGEHTQQATVKLQAIPPAAIKRKWVISLWGVTLAAIGIVMPKFLGFPWYFGAGVLGFGCWLISKDLVVSYLRFVPAVVRDIYAAVRGNGSS